MLVVPAFAKLNLALEVLSLRPDGFHELASVMVLVDWHDLVGVEVTARPPGAGPHIRLEVSGPRAGRVPADGTNLAARAAALAAADHDVTVDLRLHKRLPAAAGLGGGSSDAAAVLRACMALIPGCADPRELAPILGSDVPFLLAGGAALVRGRGELLEPLPPPDLHVAVAFAGVSSTAATYAAMHPDERAGDGRATEVARLLRHGVAPDDRLLGSALEAAAGRASPPLQEGLGRLRSTPGGATWHLTGSGGAAFALAHSAAEAAALARCAADAGFVSRACRTVTADVTGCRAPTMGR